MNFFNFNLNILYIFYIYLFCLFCKILCVIRHPYQDKRVTNLQKKRHLISHGVLSFGIASIGFVLSSTCIYNNTILYQNQSSVSHFFIFLSIKRKKSDVVVWVYYSEMMFQLNHSSVILWSIMGSKPHTPGKLTQMSSFCVR